MSRLRKLTTFCGNATCPRRDRRPMPGDVSALQLLLAGDAALLAIVRLSLIVSLSAVVFGGLIGVPFGAAVALTRFPGREAVIVILNALMGLPPVVVGLAIYLLLSRSGPLGGGPSVHPASDDRRADRADHTDHHGADAANRGGFVERVPRGARRDGCRSAPPHHDVDLGWPLQPRHRTAKERLGVKASDERRSTIAMGTTRPPAAPNRGRTNAATAQA